MSNMSVIIFENEKQFYKQFKIYKDSRKAYYTIEEVDILNRTLNPNYIPKKGCTSCKRGELIELNNLYIKLDKIFQDNPDLLNPKKIIEPIIEPVIEPVKSVDIKTETVKTEPIKSEIEILIDTLNDNKKSNKKNK